MNHEKKADCIFCKALLEDDNAENLVVYRGQTAFAILNRYPYTSGHLMVVPNDHLASLEDLPVDTLAEIMQLATQSMRILRALYHPEAFNIGANIGEAAGAGIASHVHLHVVPRWRGDTNFMSTTANTRVLPEDLAQTFYRIKKAWDTLMPRLS
jgi:ATP adenylyltransferase